MTLRPDRRPRAQAGDDGSALVELTWLGLLLLIPLVYVVITIVTVQRSAYGATEAARAAGRAFILAPDLVTAEERAYTAAKVAMADQGVRLRHDELVLDCAPTPQSCLQPGSTVRVEIRLQVSLPLVPAVLGRSPASVSVSAEHAEPYGAFREAAP